MKTSIKQQVYKRLLSGFSITGMEAIKEFGTTRLAEYIRILREEGHEIITIRVGKRRYGLYYMPLTYIHSVRSKANG